MTIDILVPTLGESITEATVATWLKKEGEAVALDEPIVELETDKVTLEVNSPAAGVIKSISVQEEDTVEVGALIGQIAEGEGAVAAPAPKQEATTPVPTTPTAAPAPSSKDMHSALSPAVSKMTADQGLNPQSIPGTGKDNRITKGDVLDFVASGGAQAAPTGPREERVKMSRLRQKIAERLKEAQNTAAMLTTYNEVDMTNVMALRGEYKDAFQKKHGIKLGFMSFFVKACITALKELPAVNAEIDGKDIVYKNHYDIGVAVGTPQGLVVPVVRDADQLSFAGVEGTIVDLGKKARDGKLSMNDLMGGTFTISNGGVYGSLLSSPIINPPQSAILGMHKIQQRPVVIDGQVVARPMMYLALSYDHRIIDGREAVTFLVRVKENIEDPQRLLLDV